MRINTLQISNMFSFDYVDEIDKAEIINFNDGLNIIIWPNWSWKSSVIEIISQIFKKYILNSPNINKSLRWTKDEGQSIIFQNYDYVKISPNWSYSDKNMSVKIMLSLLRDDIDNLKKIYEGTNIININNVLKKYTRSHMNTAPMREYIAPYIWWLMETLDISLLDDISEIKISLSFEFDPSWKLVGLKFRSDRLDLKHFVIPYLFLFSLIKETLNFENSVVNFNETFGMIWCYRHYWSIEEQYNTQWVQWEKSNNEKNRIKNELTREYTPEKEPIIFDIVKRKLAYRYKRYSRSGWNEYAKKLLKDDDLFKSIQNDLNLIWIKIWLEQNDESDSNNYAIEFFTTRDFKINAVDLSAGQKAIIHLIFSVYWLNLNNWCLVIDEPELHLHPQFEYELSQLLQELSPKFNLQFIISTHSWKFLDKNTLKNVIRLSKESGFTKSYQPDESKLLKEETIIRFLENRKLNDLFFYKKIVLVEGQSDQYFFNAFSNYYLKEKSKDILFVQMRSKNEYKSRNDFLSNFWITYYYIWDFDNIKEFWWWIFSHINKYRDVIINSNRKKIWKSMLDADIKKLSSLDWETFLNEVWNSLESWKITDNMKQIREYLISKRIRYDSLLVHIKEKDSDVYDIIMKWIESLYKNRIYILKEWDLECYLKINKSFINTINLSDNIESRYEENKEKSFVKELEFIFDEIAR